MEEISTWLLEVASHNGSTLRQVVDELDLLGARDEKHPEKSASAALQRIERRRMPQTYQRRAELDTLCSSFADGRVAVRYDRNFAREGIEQVLCSTRSEDLQHLQEHLADPTARALP